MIMLRVFRVAVILCFLPFVAYCFQAVDSKPAELKPTEVQQLRLENYQLKAQVALQNFNQAQANYNQSVTALFQFCDEVKKENNWDKGVTCDPNTLKFSPAPKAAKVDPSKSAEDKLPPEKLKQ